MIKNLIKNHYSDHNLVETCLPKPLLKVYSLNLLTRQSLTFRKFNAQDFVSVRLNCPLSWFYTSGSFSIIEKELKIQGKMLVVNDKLIDKQQLLLVDIKERNLVYDLPYQENDTDYITRRYLESLKEYLQRLKFLAKAIKNIFPFNDGYLCLFFVQELSCNALETDVFNQTLQSYSSYLSYSYPSLYSNAIFMPATLFDSSQFRPITNAAIMQKLTSFNDEFIQLIQGSKKTESIGQLFLRAFEAFTLKKIILTANFHANFSVINSNGHSGEILFYRITQLALKYSIVIAGDFNYLANHQNRQTLQKLNNPSISISFVSTPRGLQLHDTLDIIFLPNHIFN